MALPKTFPLCLALALCTATPVFAQTVAPIGSFHHEHNSLRKECRSQWRSEHMPAIREQMKAHMEQYRAANPSATKEQLHAERKSFMEGLRAQFKPQAEAQIRSCVEASHDASGRTSATTTNPMAH